METLLLRTKREKKRSRVLTELEHDLINFFTNSDLEVSEISIKMYEKYIFPLETLNEIRTKEFNLLMHSKLKQ